MIEYNVRFGDPECQTLLRNLDTDLINIITSCIDDKLSEVKIKKKDRTSVCVVVASNGYPKKFEKNFIIENIKEAEQVEDVIIFHAGTKLLDNKILSSGGRVLSITAVGSTEKGAYFFASGDYGNSVVVNNSWNFGNGYFGTTAVSSAGTNASGIGIFEYDVPSGYKALCTKGLND